MTLFDDREKAHEQKFIHDAELEFKIHAKTCKLLGLWVAGLLKLDEMAAQEYARQIATIDFDTHNMEKVIQRLLQDLHHQGIELTTDELYVKLDSLHIEAKKQVLNK